MTAVLGISAFYHDSAAALVVDGEIVAAAQEERFTRRKHDADFPAEAVRYCLREGGIEPEDLDLVGFYEKPLLKFDRLLETCVGFAPRGYRAFARAIPAWLNEKLRLPRVLRRGLDGRYARRFVFCEHHESHAASAFFPSPFDEAAVLTVDGVGEWATTTFGVGRGNEIDLTHELRFPHSPGLLYSAFTAFCGFRVNSGEYKLMGLAPYGEPKYVGLILDKLVDLKDDGSFRLNTDYFTYGHAFSMTGRRFARLFGGPARRPESEITPREVDLAASIQGVIEEVLLRTARHVHAETGRRNLCLAGGVALNCVANGRILREGPFDAVWVQPAAGDAGGALGVALLIYHQLMERPRRVRPEDAQKGSLLGPSYPPEEVRRTLDRLGARYSAFADDGSLHRRVADLLAAGKVVGWSRGRMEFGPRALGARSILGDPRRDDMQSRMNLLVKFRESFRPFAPSVLAERAGDHFDLRPGDESPYMLLTAAVREDKRRDPPPDEAGLVGLDRRRAGRSVIPAVTHVDHSARLQTVDAVRFGDYHRLLAAFEERTGCPVLVNTSFNVRGEPLVCTPEDAYRCFMATDIDALVVEDCLLLKSEQPESARRPAADHVAGFPLD